MAEPREVSGRRIRLLLAAIVGGSMALSAWWAWKVPIFQAPDEDVHFDYVASLHTEGRLLRAADREVVEMAPGGFFHPFNPLTHPYTLHLSIWSRAREIRFRPAVRVPESYGTAAYFSAIERTAPPLSSPPFRIPLVVSEFPLGYYALTALWTRACAVLFPGVVPMFFAARSVSVLLLGIGLLASFGTLRRLGATPGQGLAVITAVGFFPLTSFVSSYIQPDNLVFAALSVCMWLTMGPARQRGRRRDMFAVGVALAVLFLAKLHVFVPTFVAVVAKLAFTRRRGSAAEWLEWAMLIVGPSLLAAELQLWVSVGSGTQMRTVQAAFTPLLGYDESVRGTSPQLMLAAALRSFLSVRGGTFVTFWGSFGWADTPLVIGTPAFQRIVMRVIQAGAIALLVLLAVRAAQITASAARHWRAGRARHAVRRLVANPFVVSHVTFGVIIVAIYVATYNISPAQGRHWFAFLPIMFWEAIRYAPDALPWRRARQRLSTAVLTLLLLFSAVGSYWAIRAIETRFYGAADTRSADVRWP